MTTHTPIDRRSPGLQRLAPLAGVLFVVLTFAGDLVVGPFPDGSTPADDLRSYYAAHGAHVSLGGTILGVAGVCFAIFAVAVWARLRGVVPAVVAGVALLGAAVETASELNSGAVYDLLGRIGVDPQVTTSALQAWHISGSELGVGGGMTLFLLGVAVAGLAYRAVPRWLAAVGLVLAVAPFLPHPFGFLGSMVFLLWAAVAGITLAIRPGLPVTRSDRQPVGVG